MARKTEKGGKFRNVHCRNWNMARILKNMENEKYTLGREIWRGKQKKVENLEMSTVGL